MAMVLDAFVGRCINSLGAFIEDKLVVALEAKDELEKLQRRLVRISCVLKDAERKRIQDSAINNWLNELKDAMYDADDIIDLCCRLEGGKLLDDQPSASRVRCSFPLFSCFTAVQLRYEVGSRIRSLNKRLDEISGDKLMIKLERSGPDVPNQGVDPRQTSPVVEQDTVGYEIKYATEDLVDFLTCRIDTECCLCAITGMGGIGKTTLAQNIFNDPNIEDMFQVRVWVCVSQKFSGIDILKQIIRGACTKDEETINSMTTMTISELQPMLRDAVRGKSLFLVLDDAWRADVWVELLRNPIQGSVGNGRILVTTRDETVANKMGSARIHQVKLLPDSSGWELLCKKAFVNGGEEEIENLKDVGTRIVSKCKGLPLAIKTVGSLLATKPKNMREWEKVANSEAWSMNELPEEMRGALYLSYEDLPSHLKQCFLYCALFPEDYILRKESLVRLWVAEGFVQSQGDSVLEDIADEYWKDLQRRSLLQPLPTMEDSPCIMHDSLRSLAQFLSRDECFYGDANGITTSPTLKLRRLSVANRGNLVAIPNSVIEKKCLRTLMILETPPVIEDNLLSRLPRLRVLLLNGSAVKSIPDSIGNLVHLRYLDLRKADISSLPESIARLSNLQTLNVMDCRHLNSLPKGVTQLHNLRRLGLFNSALENVPKGIGRLKHLNDISGFVVGSEDNRVEGCGLEELNSLPKLRKLSIFNLERASDGSAVLFYKSHLMRLQLLCTPYKERRINGFPYSEEQIGRIERIVDELRPPPCLEEELCIDGFFGRSFPSWMMSSIGASLPYLVRLFLFNCELCQRLPPLGQLLQLKYLWIAHASSLASIGREFLTNEAERAASAVVFPKLEIFRIQDMPNLETWCWSQQLVDDAKENAAPQPRPELPCLQELELLNCPKLIALPTSIQHTDNNGMQSIRTFPALCRLKIQNCPELEYVENLDALQYLKLVDESMVRLLQWLLRLIQVRQNRFKMDVFCNLHVLKRCVHDGLDWPIIQQSTVANIYSYTEKGRASIHHVKEPSYYRTTNI